MVGSGPEEGALRALAGRLGIANRVLWLGERDSQDILPALDLFVLPSRKEGLPYVVLEAMSAGLPILATTAAGVEVLVQGGHNGLIVPPGRPDRLAAALLELVSNPPSSVASVATHASEPRSSRSKGWSSLHDRRIPELPGSRGSASTRRWPRLRRNPGRCPNKAALLSSRTKTEQAPWSQNHVQRSCTPARDSGSGSTSPGPTQP